MPAWVVWPVLLALTVYVTLDPATAVLALELTARVSPGTRTWTLLEQFASVLPEGQLLPTAVEVTWAVRVLSPVSGLLTVTEKVIVAVPPGARLPVQVSLGLAYETVPAVAAASPLYAASSSTPDSETAVLIPEYGVC